MFSQFELLDLTARSLGIIIDPEDVLRYYVVDISINQESLQQSSTYQDDDLTSL